MSRRPKKPGIYRITVPAIKGAYIGRSVDIPKRWDTHKRKLRNHEHSNDFLQAAWRNYGYQEFHWKIVHEGRWFLSFWERYYWSREKLNPFTIVYNEIKPSKSPRKWYMFWRARR